MAVATISLFILCDDSCGGADHYPCLLTKVFAVNGPF